MQWSSHAAAQLKVTNGLVQWTPVEGATGYQVMFQGPSFKKVVSTPTNVADQRELWAFHDASGTSSVDVARAGRAPRLRAIPNGLPAVILRPVERSVYTSPNPDPRRPGRSRSRGRSRTSARVHEVAQAHQLMPALAWNGTVGIDGQAHTLFRAYVSTDAACVNTVFRGAIVGSPAYAPRTSGPAEAPDLGRRAHRGGDDDPRGRRARERHSRPTPRRSLRARRAPPSATEAGTAAAAASPGNRGDAGRSARRRLPVDPLLLHGRRRRHAESMRRRRRIKYVDAELPQDVCAAGRVLSFGKKSRAVVTSIPTPLVIGLLPDGTLLTAASKQPARVLDAARHLARRRSGRPRTRCSGRGRVHPLAARGPDDHLRHLVAARPADRQVVLPGARPQPGAAPQVGDGLVDADAVTVATPTFKVVKIAASSSRHHAPGRRPPPGRPSASPGPLR